MQCEMNAIIRIKTVICDIPIEFLQKDWPRDINYYLVLERDMVDMLCNISPEYKNDVMASTDIGLSTVYN